MRIVKFEISAEIDEETVRIEGPSNENIEEILRWKHIKEIIKTFNSDELFKNAEFDFGNSKGFIEDRGVA